MMTTISRVLLRCSILCVLLCTSLAWLPSPNKRSLSPKPSSPPTQINKPIKPQTDLDSALAADAFVTKQQDNAQLIRGAISLIAAATVSLGAALLIHDANLPTIYPYELELYLSHGAVQRVQFSGTHLATVHVVYKDGSAARIPNGIVTDAHALAAQCETYHVSNNYAQALQQQQALLKAEQEIADASLEASMSVNAGLL